MDWLACGSVTFLDHITKKREKRKYAKKGYLASHGSIPRATFEVNGMIPRLGGKRLEDMEFFKLRDNAGEEVWFSYNDEGIEQAWQFLEAAAQRRGETLIRPAPFKLKNLGETVREAFPRLFSWTGMAKRQTKAQQAAVELVRGNSFLTPDRDSLVVAPRPLVSASLMPAEAGDVPVVACSSKSAKTERMPSSGYQSMTRESVADSGLSLRANHSQETSMDMDKKKETAVVVHSAH